MTEKDLSFYLSTLDLSRAKRENQKMKFGNKAISALLEKLENDLPKLVLVARQLEIRSAIGLMMAKSNQVDKVMSDYLDANPDVKERLTKQFTDGTI
jgi:hypothetical protein